MKEYIDDLEINYVVKGEGSPILLLQGWGTNIDIYNTLIEGMSSYSKVYALDLPGFENSSEPKESWDLDQYVEFIIKFIHKFNIKELDLLGHSFGGRIIIKLLNRKNLDFKINKVILIGSAGIKHKLSFPKKVKVKIFKIGKIISKNKIVGKIFGKSIDHYKQNAGSEDYRNATPIMKECMVKTINEDLTNLLPNITQETLLIWGEKDDATPLSDGILMNKLIKESGLVEIKGASHYVFLESPGYVNSIIESFLKSQR